MTGTTLFVSDVHIHEEGRGQALFLSFLERVASRADHLYIHGDLFDFYIGPRQGRHPFHRPLFEAIEGLTREGTAVFLQRGNRDFMAGTDFERRGVTVLPDETTLELDGLRVHLSHGDQFCIHDRSYQFWSRRLLRSQPCRLLLGALPVRAAVWAARRYRGISERKKRRYQARGARSRLETILDGVRLLLARDPHDAVICGHIHELARTRIDVGGRPTTLFTTGAWEESPNFVQHDGQGLRLMLYDAETGEARPPPSSPADRAGEDGPA